MSDPTPEIDRLDTRYRVRFAGHPRVTRDPDELQSMVEALAALGVTEEAHRARVATLSDQWTRELEQIRAAQAVPYAVPAARLRTWSDLSVSRYARSFGGRDRRTRDVALLQEIVDDLRGIRNSMASLAQSAPDQGLGRSVQQIDQQLLTYLSELEAIRNARKMGTPAEQGTRFAQLANDQFAEYERHFAGHPRLSRHPATLSRILASLDELRRGMQGLALQGFDDPSNTRNIGIVTQRLASFRAELDAIGKARAEATLETRVTGLGAAANEVFAKYREAFAGKDRRSVDPERLVELFELLWPIAREMDEIDAEHDDDTNHANLRLVLDNAVLYAREFDAIQKVKASPA